MGCKTFWTHSMDQKLCLLYHDHTNDEIARIMNLKKDQISHRRTVLGLQKSKEHLSGRTRFDLSVEQIDFIKANYDSMSNKELSEALGLKIQLLRKKIYELGLYRYRLEYWTEEQIDYLKENYRNIGDKELAKIFNELWKKQKAWTLKHIEKKRNYLNLHRTKKEIVAIKERNRLNGSWSVSFWEHHPELVAPIGDIRMWTNQQGRRYQVIRTENGFEHHARWLYKQIHGSIPEGKKVRLLDNDPENVIPGNLYLVDNEQNARINSKTSSGGLSDNYVAGILTHGRPDLRAAVRSAPDLIELKRKQLILQRTIKQHGKAK